MLRRSIFDAFETSLSDTFADAARRIGGATRLCAPVDVDAEGVIDSNRHLTCYELEILDRRLRRQRASMLVSDRFGEEQMMTVRGSGSFASQC